MKPLLSILMSALMVSALSACQLFEGAASQAPESSVVLTDFQGAWQVQSLRGAESVPDSRAFLEFSDPPRLTGNGGCNRFFGVYQYEAPVLTIDPSLGSTKMACEASVMVQEQQLFQLLPQAVQVSLSEQGVLVLKDAGGVELVRAVRRSDAGRPQ